MLSKWTNELFGSKQDKEKRARNFQRERLELLRELKGSIQSVVEYASYSNNDINDEAVNSVTNCELDEKIHVMQDLMLWLERCLWHGLKTEVKYKAKRGDKTVWVSEQDVSMWNYVQRLWHGEQQQNNQNHEMGDGLMEGINKSVRETKELLFVRSNVGLGRAWLRIALNEKILDRTLSKFVTEYPKLVEVYYEDYALIRDEEACAIFISMLAGLSGLEIKMHVDVDWLDVRAAPLRRPIMLVSSDSSTSNQKPASNSSSAYFDQQHAQEAQERKEFAVLQAKLNSQQQQQQQQGGAASSGGKKLLNSLRGTWNQMITGQNNNNNNNNTDDSSATTTNENSRNDGNGRVAEKEENEMRPLPIRMDRAAKSVHRRASYKRRQREHHRKGLEKNATVFGTNLEDVSGNVFTSALAFYDQRLAVPDILLRACALLWTMIDNDKIPREARSQLFSVRGKDSDTIHEEIFQLKRVLVGLGGDGLRVFAHVGADIDLKAAFATIATTTRTGISDVKLVENPKVIAGLIQLFCRQLPNPVIPFDTFDPMLACLQIEEEEPRLRNLQCLIDTFPWAHKSALDILLELFSKICTDDEQIRDTVSSMMAPALIRPCLVGNGPESAARPIGQFHDAAQVLNTLIQSQDVVMSNVHTELREIRKHLAGKLDRIRLVKEGLTRSVLSDGNRPLLEILWEKLGPSRDDMQMGLDSEGWLKRGAMSTDINKEFRGGGETGLKNLVYFLGKHHKKARLMIKSAKYPFIQAACQISRMTTDVLGLFLKSDELAMEPWWHLLDERDSVERVFCMTFLLLDLNFAESNATAMDFNRVAQETKFQMTDLLGLEPRNVNQLWHSWIQLRAERMFLKDEDERRQQQMQIQMQTSQQQQQQQQKQELETRAKESSTKTDGSNVANSRAMDTHITQATPVHENAAESGEAATSATHQVVLDQLLPYLLQETKILTNSTYIAKLETWLSDSYHGYDWSLVFSTDRNGCDLSEFYKLSEKHDATILVIKDTKGNIFGGFNATALRIHDTYFGTGESFLFALEPEFAAYKWFQGNNNYFILANEDSLAMGSDGMGQFGLFIDEDLQSGQSYPCPTFNSPALVTGNEFECECIELWTFKVRNRKSFS